MLSNVLAETGVLFENNSTPLFRTLLTILPIVLLQ